MSAAEELPGVRTMLRMRTREGCEAAFEAAWRRAAAEIARVPGNLRQELVRDVEDPRTFLITSDWTDRAAVERERGRAARERAEGARTRLFAEDVEPG